MNVKAVGDKEKRRLRRSARPDHIAASIAQFGSVLLFEWLRLSALRFGDHVHFSGMGVIEYYGLIGATLAIAGG
ncbi:MAG: hypothetical protein J0H81_06630, partial [Sphingopyxis terrae]|nr:hypothetical protein [Sphingopyxis terrae]